jgi:hypothetical protein
VRVVVADTAGIGEVWGKVDGGMTRKHGVKGSAGYNCVYFSPIDDNLFNGGDTGIPTSCNHRPSNAGWYPIRRPALSVRQLGLFN